MTVENFISLMRLAVGDLKTTTQDKWAGDGATTAFRSTEHPIADNAYQVYLYSGSSWTQKAETTHYTLDKDTGIITMLSAPASGSASSADGGLNLRMDYSHLFMRDDEWLEIIKLVLRRWKRKLFTVDTDETTFNTVKDQDEYDMDDISDRIFWVTQFEYKKGSDAEWMPVAAAGTNWVYEPELNKIIVKPSFNNADYDLRVMYVKASTPPTSVSDDMPADDFLGAIQIACESEYMRRFANYKLRDKTAVTKEMTYHPAIEMLRQSAALRTLADEELALVKPRFPTQAIRIFEQGRKN